VQTLAKTDAKARKRVWQSWKNISGKLHSGEMPPPEEPQPRRSQNVNSGQWIDTQLAKVFTSGPRDPGRVTIRRLNRAEYNNTIRDLVGVDFQPADDFPADDVGYGFDNIGDVLSMPPLLLEKYLAAAEKIARQVIEAESPPEPKTTRSMPCNSAAATFSAERIPPEFLSKMARSSSRHKCHRRETTPSR